jgi:UDP-glucose 4-epimerase
MRILVTGGAGFIASHIAEAYLRAKHDVIVVDNLSQGKEEHVPRGATFHHLDILDPGLEEIVSRERPEVISHHAAQIDVRRSVADPAFDAKVNILGTLQLLTWARQYGTRMVIFASSGGTIYGEENTLPISEEHPARPQSPYGLSKYVGECYLELHRALFGLDAVILRYANVYGPRQDPKGEAGVMAIFCENILEGKPLAVFGDGSQTRDYVFVSDVVEANLLALDMKGFHILNIGTERETSVNELIHFFEEAVGRALPHHHAPSRQGELQRSCLAISRAETTLGWRPKVPLSEGIRKTFGWLQQAEKSEVKT